MKPTTTKDPKARRPSQAGAVRISFGGFQQGGASGMLPVASGNQDVWLVIANESVDQRGTTAMRRGALIALPQDGDRGGRPVPLEEGSQTPSEDGATNGCTVVQISGGLESLRDALNEHLPPPPSTTEEVSRANSIVTHLYPVEDFDENPPPPASPRGNRYYPQELSEVKRFELFRRVIEHEDDLLNQRVSWIILAQSFLMAAFITTSENLVSKYVTAFCGLATVVVTLPAILAAGRNIEVQQTVYFHGLESDAQCLALHGHPREISIKPTLEETKRRLQQGHIFPNTAFRGKHSLPILSTVIALAFVQVAGWVFLLVVLVWEG